MAPNCAELITATLAAQLAGIAAPLNGGAVPGAPRRAAAPLRRPRARHRRPRARPGRLGERARARRHRHARRHPRRCGPPAPTDAPEPLPELPGVRVDYLGDLAASSDPARFAGSPPTVVGPRRAVPHRRHHRRTEAGRAHPRQRGRRRLDAGRVLAGSTPTPTVFAALPLFHVNALIVTVLMPLFKGQQVRVGRAAGLPRPRAVRAVLDARRALPDRRDERRTHRLRRPAQHPGRRATSAACASPMVGASPLPAAVRDGFQAHTGVRLIEGYGLTEATCASARSFPDAAPARLGRAAAAVPAGESRPRRRRRARGTDLPPGQSACWRSAARPCSPATSPDATTTATSWTAWASWSTAGWTPATWPGSTTDGFVYLTGRAKDLIIRGGHNIDPADHRGRAARPPPGHRGRRRRPARRARR